jgi:hypothetical protein
MTRLAQPITDITEYDSQGYNAAVNASITFTLPATVGRRWRLDMITCSIKALTAVTGSSQVLVQDGAANIWAAYAGIPQATPGAAGAVALTGLFLIGSPNTAMTIIASAGEANTITLLAYGATLL